MDHGAPSWPEVIYTRGGGGAPLLRERAAGRGMVLVLDALNRVCYFT